MKSKPIVDFESYLKSVKSNKWFHSKKIYIYIKLTIRKCLDCLKLRLNKNEHVCKKCGSDFLCTKI